MACKWSVSFFKIMIPWQWTTKVLLIVSTFSIYSSANDTGLLTVDVKAPWKRIDFVSNFIESIAGFNASLYIPTLEAIFGLGDSDVSEGRTDKEIYDYTMKQLSLEPSAIDFVNFNLNLF